MQRAFLLTALALMACRQRMPPSTPAQTEARDSAPRVAATHDAAPLPGGGAAEAQPVCEGVAAFWRRQPVTVRLVDSVIQPPRADTSVRACVVLMNDGHGLARLRRSGPTDTLGLARALVGGARPGWVQLMHFAADGPAGDETAFQRGTIRCSVQQTWAAAEDDPGDWLEEVTECWPVRSGITVSDTAS